MNTLKAYFDLCRVSNLPTIWTNVLASGLLAGAPLMHTSYVLLAAAMSFFYVAGMSFNDVCDVEHDRLSRPARPIPSGRVSLRKARLLTVVLFATGFALLALAPRAIGMAAGVLLLLAIVAYDLHHKRNPYSVFIMAACRLLVFVVTALALVGEVPTGVLLAGAAQFLYVVVISLVARYENGRGRPFPFPVVPAMLAGISLLDGLMMALLYSAPWLLAGVAGALLTCAGQRYVRGD